mmetsp:Transcript_2233/g.9291  ORF Transcript_2233/g.9291 Transcript_2233/m.9291 type:complete len:261 (+) Transcript_2233:383-1165(+)
MAALPARGRGARARRVPNARRPRGRRRERPPLGEARRRARRMLARRPPRFVLGRRSATKLRVVGAKNMGASHQAHARADRQGRPTHVSRPRAARQSPDAESVGKSLARIRRRVAERRVLPRHELHRWGVSFAHGGRSRFLVAEPSVAFDFTGVLRSQRRDEGALGGPGSVTGVGGVKDTGVSQSAGRKRVPVTRGGERVVHGALRQRVAVGDVFTSVGRDAVRADASAAFPNRARGDGAGPDDDKKELESSLRDGDDDGE